MKSVTLPGDVWATVVDVLRGSTDPRANRVLLMLDEQVSGRVRVSTGRNGVVKLIAGPGGDLRNSAMVKP